jgi:hypothetical protein
MQTSSLILISFCTAAKTSCQLSSVKRAEVAGFEEQPTRLNFG